MCLSMVHSKEEQIKIIQKLTKKGGWITVWKVVAQGMRSRFRWFRFKKGINKSPFKKRRFFRGNVTYAPYFHSYRTRLAARFHCVWEHHKVIKCRVRPSWITNIGQQQGQDVIVSKKIIMPRKRN